MSNVLQWEDPGSDSEIADLYTTEYTGSTTLKYDEIKDIKQWAQDGAIADVLVEKTLREGLGMFDGLDKLDTHYSDIIDK